MSTESASEKRHLILLVAAAVSFLPALGFHYVGEEAIFPISSLEMWYHRQWVEQLLYGGSLKHNPLYNWLIIPFAVLVGWEHMLGVARAIAVAATLATAAVVGWLAANLYRDRVFALFCALVYLTLADVLFYRGWLAYVDPLFAFFVAAAIACLWMACLRERGAWLWAAVAALTVAFMSKALTAYVFYGGAALVLLLSDGRYRRLLLGGVSRAAHLLAVLFPLGWLYFVPRNVGQGGRMFGEIIAKLAPETLVEYLTKLALYPLDTLLRLAPVVFVAAYYLWRRRTAGDEHARHTGTALAIAAISYLPYWFAPQSAIRYLMPIYPFAALAIARPVWMAGPRAVTVAQRWLIAAIALKLAVVLAIFPYYQRHYRGENYALVAGQILERTAGHPLYTTNVSASGLSVAAHLDIRRLPAPPLTFPPAQWDSGFVIAYTPEPAVGRVAEKYRLGGNDLYLLCRGGACAAAAK